MEKQWNFVQLKSYDVVKSLLYFTDQINFQISGFWAVTSGQRDFF